MYLTFLHRSATNSSQKRFDFLEEIWFLLKLADKRERRAANETTCKCSGIDSELKPC